MHIKTWCNITRKHQGLETLVAWSTKHGIAKYNANPEMVAHLHEALVNILEALGL